MHDGTPTGGVGGGGAVGATAVRRSPEAWEAPEEARRTARERLDEPAGVWGLVIGRALLYPSDEDVATAVGTAVAMLEVA
ncbi:Cgl0159 family (beta/alpha)8-fold protein [Streptosporangium carneum]|uniref:Cgl0159-like domain-containing protein n=1 Tax=Streptosporangium carneum TaxID=47481 RepID=A0A9W6MFA4_9ACTN|nr:hypothetical protein [Streptosporangium carneum]GLK11683.1 hypothetical protein GCM10017600_50900 [Streptosporangium carneum]